MRTTPSLNLLKKLERLVKAAGFEKIDFSRKMTAIKVHFGEPGNLAYLRPNFAARVAEMIREKGGKPYLTDCNTLYHGERSCAPDHLEAAFSNGYNPLSAGCHVVIGDGIKGTDYREVEVNLEHTAKAMIGTAIADADIIISLNHFKGHEQTGFGGALKNLGMGCASVGGKLFLHSGNPPSFTVKTVQVATCVSSTVPMMQYTSVKTALQLSITANVPVAVSAWLSASLIPQGSSGVPKVTH